MKTASVILLSWGLTLLLLGLNLSLYQARQHRTMAPKAAVQEVTNNVRRVIRYHPTPPPPPPPPPAFTWGQIESEDYATYIANLRDVGCPQKTIQDIILADIEKNYESRQDLLDNAAHADFWQTGAQRDAAARRTARLALDLDREKHALIKQLLGLDVDAESEKTWQEESRVVAPLLGFLPAAKGALAVVVYLRAKRLVSTQRVLTDGILTPADLAEQETIYRAVHDELNRFLAPNELEELQLRLAAIDDRRGSSVEMSGGELRRYARLMVDARDPLRELFDLTGEVTAEQQQAASEKFASETLKLLGPARFADYQRDQDVRFREVYSLTEKNQLPKATAIKIYEIRQSVDAQAEQTRNDPNLSDDERSILLHVLRLQTEKTFARYLGPKIFAEYQKSGARWLDRLGTENPTPSAPPPLPPGN